jgi:hypothetical protein
MKKINYYSFILLFELIFLLILYKVIFVPITHDETNTIWYYSNFNVWRIIMFPDNVPNNHILNTLLTKGFLLLFGNEQWAARLPNLLSFILYAFAIFRICKAVLKSESIFFIPAAILFIANPYLLDFFGLCRGYGMSCALCTLSVSYLISGYSTLEKKHIWTALILSILASYANFTLLVFWCSTVLITWFYFFAQFKNKLGLLFKPTLIISIISIIYIALIAIPLHKMQSTDQFQYWTSSGFYKETILPLIIHSLYGSHRNIFLHFNSIAFIVIGIVLINFIYVIYRFAHSQFQINSFFRPVFVTTSIILLTAGINILQSLIFHTPNLNGRTALFFYPLFISAFVTTLGLFSKIKISFLKRGIAIIITFVCLFQLSDTMSLKSVREWWFDANTFKVIEFLKNTNNNQDVSLKTNWLFHPSFYFYKYAGKIPWIDLKDYDKNIELNTDAEYYYILAENYNMLEPKFEPVIKFDNGCWLLKKKLPSK